jgi:hypothetical protein
MVCVDIRHHGNGGREREKGTIIFVGLDDVQAIAPSAQIAGPARHAPARKRCRISTGARQRFGYHDCCRRLAMGSGDGDDLAPTRYFSERVRATDDRYSTGAGTLQLRVVARHRRSNDERAGAFDVTGVMRTNIDAESPQVICAVRIAITTCYANAPAHEQLGERAHAGAGYAHEMNGPLIGRIQERHRRARI